MIQTRLTNIYKSVEEKCKTKIFRFQTLFIRSLLSLFLGFLTGSIFATFLPFFREFLHWDGFIILFLLSSSEFIAYVIYHKEDRKFLFFNFTPNDRTFWEFSNIFKNGVFFGFFVDAFKVGS
jgi:hypothetical protein